MKAIDALRLSTLARLAVLTLPFSAVGCSGDDGDSDVSSSIGGTAATGGLPTGGFQTGGVTPGGTAAGGLGMGGMATGGAVTGGALTGGMPAGGTATGGTATGGAGVGGTATGGAGVGGTATGGAGVGGTATGGAGMGGTATGGAAGGTDTGGAATGGTATGGAATGGSTTGGMPATGGTTGGSTLADQYPCDAGTDGYDAVITGSGSSWSVNGSGNYGSLLDAAGAALGSGGSSDSNKRTVLLVDDGDVPANAQLRIPSNTVFNMCGTITVVEPSGGSDRSPCYARGASNIDLPHINIRGIAQYGCFFRDVDNVHIGIADVRIGGGLGIRVDNNANNGSNAARRSGYQLDEVYVENVSHGVEFYGIRDITIGTVVARNTSQAGLMLNNSVDVEVGLVDGQFVSPDAGYAVFRMANDNGKDWDTGTHPMSIHVGKVIARESGGSNGQGIFCLTDSGGATVDEVDLENTASNAIWLEWCTNVVIGNPNTQSRIVNSGMVGFSYDPAAGSTRQSNQLVFENIAISNTNVGLIGGGSTCPPDVSWINVTNDGSAVTLCE